MPSERATSLRSRSISASRLSSTRARSGRTTAAKMRRSSSEPSSTWTPLRRKICAASCTRSSALASAANRVVGLGPRRHDQPRLAIRELRPDLLRHVRHHRVQEREQTLERGERGRDRRLVTVVEPRLDRLGVPVAEVVEGEVVERGRRLREVEPRPGVLELGTCLVEPREDPALLEALRRRGHLDALGVLEDQPRHVPELDRELPPLLDRAVREAHVLRRGDLQQPVARRVGSVLLDRLHRVDAGPEALRHAPAVEREHRRVDDHVGERNLAERLEARPDHPVLPEADDLARGRVDVPRVVARELGRLVGPAERGERPERRREPGVEDVGLARELGRAALAALRTARRPERSGGRRGTSRSAADAPTRAAARCTSRASPRAR